MQKLFKGFFQTHKLSWYPLQVGFYVCW